MRFCLAVAVLAYLCSTNTLACQYASRSLSELPAGHPDIAAKRNLADDTDRAPTPRPVDVAGGSFEVPGGGISAATGFSAGNWIDYFDDIAKNVTEDLCYWSWQSLPPPYPWNTTINTYDFHALNQTFPGDVEAIRDLGELAVRRLQAFITDKTGPVYLAGCSQGTDFASYLCNEGLYNDVPERCAAGSPLYTQDSGIRWPMAVTMFKFDGTNGAEINDLISTWRSSEAGHLPNIMSPRVVYVRGDTGWGIGGVLAGKLLPCSHVSDDFKYHKDYSQDASPTGWTKTGKTFLEYAMDEWASIEGCQTVAECKARIASKCDSTHCSACADQTTCEDAACSWGGDACDDKVSAAGSVSPTMFVMWASAFLLLARLA